MERRVAIVTGASRGIGKEIAARLATDGCHVVLTARSPEALEAVRGAIAAAGGSAETRVVDMTDGEAVTAAVEEVASTHGRLDILVNNAGMTRDGLFLRMSDDDFDSVLTVNLRSVFVACRAAARPMMRGKWGRIINIGSVSGLMGNPGQANYATAKAGLIGLTKTIARELGSKGITANVVAPGFIETDMTASLPQELKDEVIKGLPLRRFGRSEEIAHVVSFLASDLAGYLTAQVLVVDGGLSH
ncbi:MAG: 3-oxoacyl-[acyl-carrier-protein] reductase [Phycisphaerales bacterium]|nr:3-oxoacyl-[acyl-carrier-protein] reductase [Phycisphaerales bacterium]